jgi:hypothetical protein
MWAASVRGIGIVAGRSTRSLDVIMRRRDLLAVGVGFAAIALFDSFALAESNSRFAELTPADRDRLDRQREAVSRLVKYRYGVDRLTRSKADIPILQRILDERVYSPTQTYQLQSLGVVFGDVLASELGLRWMIVTDEYGTAPTLRYRNSTVQINALTMISKRVEDRQPADVQSMFDGVRSHLLDLQRSGQYK